MHSLGPLLAGSSCKASSKSAAAPQAIHSSRLWGNALSMRGHVRQVALVGSSSILSLTTQAPEKRTERLVFADAARCSVKAPGKISAEAPLSRIASNSHSRHCVKH